VSEPVLTTREASPPGSPLTRREPAEAIRTAKPWAATTPSLPRMYKLEGPPHVVPSTLILVVSFSRCLVTVGKESRCCKFCILAGQVKGVELGHVGTDEEVGSASMRDDF
jgi:hypothetical protein